MLQNLITLIQSFIGVVAGSKEHKKILDTYNKISPLPRGYKVKTTDAWCATFVSAIFSMLGVKKFPFECSCYMMTESAKAAGLWVENDGFTPSPGDCVLYDWQDNGKGDNKGTPDHIGIVENVKSSGMIEVVEGNFNNAVKRRYIKVNDRYIRGYIRSSTLLKTGGKIDDELVDRIIRGDYGNGETRKKKLEAEGYDYEKVRAAVNAKLKK